MPTEPCDCPHHTGEFEDQWKAIEDTINSRVAWAVAEEREACAAIAEDPKFYRKIKERATTLCNEDVAAAIRARSNS